MFFAKKMLLAATCLAVGLGIGAAASALSLADLVVPGAIFSSGNGAVYSNFAVQIRGGRLSENLSDYEILATADGFTLGGDFSAGRKGGMLVLSYRVTGSGMNAAALDIGVGLGNSGRIQVTEDLFEIQNIARLKASTEHGRTSDDAVFSPFGSLQIREKIKIKGDYFQLGSGASLARSFALSAPEPTTALLLGAGLAGLSAAGRKRSR